MTTCLILVTILNLAMPSITMDDDSSEWLNHLEIVPAGDYSFINHKNYLQAQGQFPEYFTKFREVYVKTIRSQAKSRFGERFGLDDNFVAVSELYSLSLKTNPSKMNEFVSSEEERDRNSLDTLNPYKETHEILIIATMRSVPEGNDGAPRICGTPFEKSIFGYPYAQLQITNRITRSKTILHSCYSHELNLLFSAENINTLEAVVNTIAGQAESVLEEPEFKEAITSLVKVSGSEWTITNSEANRRLRSRVRNRLDPTYEGESERVLMFLNTIATVGDEVHEIYGQYCSSNDYALSRTFSFSAAETESNLFKKKRELDEQNKHLTVDGQLFLASIVYSEKNIHKYMRLFPTQRTGMDSGK